LSKFIFKLKNVNLKDDTYGKSSTQY